MGKNEFSFDTSSLLKAAEGLVEGGEQIVVAMGQAQIANERRRAKEGKGVDDQPMKDYSPQYAEQKRESGRQADVRDLTVTGRMLRSRVAEKPVRVGDSHEVTLTFSDARSKLVAGANQQRTPFFGVSPRDEQVLQDVAEKELNAVIEELNKGE